MSEADTYLVVLGIVIGAMTLMAYGAGKGTHNLARMEILAASNVVRQEVSFEYQMLRLSAMRMAWVALDPSAKKEYIHMFGRPTFAKQSTGEPDPLEDVPKVHVVRGRTV